MSTWTKGDKWAVDEILRTPQGLIKNVNTDGMKGTVFLHPTKPGAFITRKQWKIQQKRKRPQLSDKFCHPPQKV
jgi:hypothetical protein